MNASNCFVRRATANGVLQIGAGNSRIRGTTSQDYVPKLSSAGSRRSVSIEDCASLVERIEIFKKISPGSSSKVYKGKLKGVRNPPIVAIKAVSVTPFTSL